MNKDKFNKSFPVCPNCHLPWDLCACHPEEIDIAIEEYYKTDYNYEYCVYCMEKIDKVRQIIALYKKKLEYCPFCGRKIL